MSTWQRIVNIVFTFALVWMCIRTLLALYHGSLDDSVLLQLWVALTVVGYSLRCIGDMWTEGEA